MAEIRIGRFLSRDIDSTTLRTGRSSAVTMRSILACDGQGQIQTEVCLVPFPSDRPHAISLEKLEKIMTLLDAGDRATSAAAR